MNGPGKSHRKGISLLDLATMFPTEEAATEWFEKQMWPTGRACPKCGGTETSEVPNRKPMPYWCKGCRSYFSVRTGTALERSKVPLRKWAFAVYIVTTSLKSVSSMKLHRDLGVTQKTAWFMLHRLREAWASDGAGSFGGPVEVGRDLHGWQGAEQGQEQAAGCWWRDRREDGGAGREGPGDEAGSGQGHRPGGTPRPFGASWPITRSRVRPSTPTARHPTGA